MIVTHLYLIKYLQLIKDDPKSPIYGYYLALRNNNQNNEARHFGINMIINAVSYKWNEKTYSDNERNELRRMALDLLKVSIFRIFKNPLYK